MKNFILIFFLGLNLLPAGVALALSNESENAENRKIESEIPGNDGEVSTEPKTFEDLGVSVQYDQSAELGKEVSFEMIVDDESPLKGEFEVRWKFSDGKVDSGLKVNHAFSSSGLNDVHVTISSNAGVWSKTFDVFVYKELIFLITDQEELLEKINSLTIYAEKQGIFLKRIESFGALSDYLNEEVLSKKILESVEDLKKAHRLIIWTKSDLGLTLVSRVKRQTSNLSLSFKNKEIYFITDSNIDSLANIAAGIFAAVDPRSIVITRFESLWPLLDSKDLSQFIPIIEERGYDYKIVDSGKQKISFTNFMVYLVNFMIDRGIPSNTLKLILVLPVIVTVVSFMKQIVGISTLGVYTPSIITLSLIALDIQYGLGILIILLLVGTLSRYVLKRYRLLYIPKMAILITVESIAIFFLLFLGSYFNIIELVSLSIFPILIMGTIVEKFVSIQTDKGLKMAFFLIVETLIVSLIAYFVAEWNLVKTLLLGHPELIFGFLIVNIFLGRWTGLRLFEYVRFRELLFHKEEEEE